MNSRAMLVGAVSVLLLPTAGMGQLGSRPAEEWAITLESGQRLEGLQIQEVVRRMELKPGEVVADIGAGTGVFSIPIALAVGTTGRVLAVEVDAGFLPMIREKAAAARIGNIEAVLGEFQDPKLPRRDVNVAFFHDVLHHIQDRQGYLRAVASYMAPSSRIIVVDFEASHPSTPHQNEPAMLITAAQVDEWMQAIGFAPTQEIRMFEEKFYRVYTRQN